MFSTDPFPAIDQLPLVRLAASGTLPPSVVAAAEQGRSAGYEEGVRAGYRDGEAAAHDDVRSDVSFALTALHAAIEDLHRRDSIGASEMSATIVDLALAVSEAVIGRELSVAANPGRDALVRALALAPDRGATVARFHPDDLSVLGDLADLTAGRTVELVPDATVSRGGCVVHVGAAQIDAQIESALERVRAQLQSGDLAGELHDESSYELDGADSNAFDTFGTPVDTFGTPVDHETVATW